MAPEEENTNSNFRKNKLLRNIVCVIAVLFLVSVATISFICVNKTKSTNELKSESTNIEQQHLEVVEHHICADEFENKAICGTIQNNTDKHYSYVQLDIDFYDNNGVQVGNSSNNVNKIDPHGTLKFKVLINENNVDTYKIKSVDGYVLSLHNVLKEIKA